MKAKPTILFTLLAIILFASKSFSQSPTDKIDLKNFKPAYLAELINNEIGKIRDSLGSHKLVRDSILELAAKNQAAYIKKTDDISHMQPEPEFSTLDKRVEYFKGSQEKLSEIIDVIYLDKPTQIYKQKETIKIYTYGEAANFFIKNTINTSNHFDVLIKRDFYTSGLAFGVNEERKCIYVVDVFGSRSYKFHHSVKKKEYKKVFYPSKKSNIENAYGVEPYEEKFCTKCVEKFNSIPDYITYGLVVENNKIYFQFSDVAVFEKVFYDGDEAIAVDVVHLDQFPCNQGNMLHRSDIHDGIMFKPLTKNEILKNNQKKDGNQIYTFIGDCPFTNPAEYELSLLLIKNNKLCSYGINPPSVKHTLELIETEMYTDTISKSEILKKKNLRFGIPFEKSKAEYKETDIKPFYDSLQLNRFNIKELTILAYSSVEGSSEKNLELSKQRAQSIVNSVQAFQFDSIKTVIRTLENWDQFYRDIKNTPYAYLATLEKSVIKEKLQQDSLINALEPILKKERKAFITLKVVENIDLTGNNKSELLPHFKTAISKKDIANASTLQTAIFEAITGGDLSQYSIDAIPLPKTKEFAQMINNDIIFRYTNKIPMDYVKALEDASALEPSNLFIKYNIYNMTLKGWADSSIKVSSPDPIIKNIKTLFNTKIDKKQVNQLYLNYYILATDYYKKIGKFKYRDDAVAVVKKYYKTFDASQKDILTLANYFSSHGREDYAQEILLPSIQSGDYNEDMLFYYLSISISDLNDYEKNGTVSLLKKAKEINKERFCKLYGEEKLRFQIFKNIDSKNLYCDNCK